MFTMSVKLLNTYNTFAGIITFKIGMAMITYKVWNVPHSMLSAKLKKMNKNKYNQNKILETFYIVSDIKVNFFNSSSLPISIGISPTSFH